MLVLTPMTAMMLNVWDRLELVPLATDVFGGGVRRVCAASSTAVLPWQGDGMFPWHVAFCRGLAALATAGAWAHACGVGNGAGSSLRHGCASPLDAAQPVWSQLQAVCRWSATLACPAIDGVRNLARTNRFWGRRDSASMRFEAKSTLSPTRRVDRGRVEREIVIARATASGTSSCLWMAALRAAHRRRHKALPCRDDIDGGSNEAVAQPLASVRNEPVARHAHIALFGDWPTAQAVRPSVRAS